MVTIFLIHELGLVSYTLKIPMDTPLGSNGLLIYKKKHCQQNIYNYSFWIFNYFNFYIFF